MIMRNDLLTESISILMITIIILTKIKQLTRDL